MEDIEDKTVYTEGLAGGSMRDVVEFLLRREIGSTDSLLKFLEVDSNPDTRLLANLLWKTLDMLKGK